MKNNKRDFDSVDCNKDETDNNDVDNINSNNSNNNNINNNDDNNESSSNNNSYNKQPSSPKKSKLDNSNINNNNNNSINNDINNNNHINNNNINNINKSIMGFQTGRGHLVSISDEKLEQAKKRFNLNDEDEDIPQPNSKPPEFMGFRTGRDQDIIISKEKLEEAAKKYDKEEYESNNSNNNNGETEDSDNDIDYDSKNNSNIKNSRNNRNRNINSNNNSNNNNTNNNNNSPSSSPLCATQIMTNDEINKVKKYIKENELESSSSPSSPGQVINNKSSSPPQPQTSIKQTSPIPTNATLGSTASIKTTPGKPNKFNNRFYGGKSNKNSFTSPVKSSSPPQQITPPSPSPPSPQQISQLQFQKPENINNISTTTTTTTTTATNTINSSNNNINNNYSYPITPSKVITKKPSVPIKKTKAFTPPSKSNTTINNKNINNNNNNNNTIQSLLPNKVHKSLSPNNFTNSTTSTATFAPVNKIQDKRKKLKELGTPFSISPFGLVKKEILEINSKNSQDYRFENCGDIKDIGKSKTIGVAELFIYLLKDSKSNALLLNQEWVRNHYGWIVWKLAAMERSFPQIFANKYLTLQRVIDQLRYRIEKEINQAKRSILKKIYERDEPSEVPLILCVSSILDNALANNRNNINNKTTPIAVAAVTTSSNNIIDTNEITSEDIDEFMSDINIDTIDGGLDTTKLTSITTKQEKQVEEEKEEKKLGINNKAAIIELTDGWYSIKAALDPFLSQMLHQGKIYIGQKLSIQNAQIVGEENGISPLEDGYENVYLKLFTNSTRRAKWYEKLGKQKEVFPITLKSVVAGGGQISCLRVQITHLYKLSYKEIIIDQDNVKTVITRNEAEEEAYKHQFETKAQDAREKLLFNTQKELEKKQKEQLILATASAASNGRTLGKRKQIPPININQKINHKSISGLSECYDGDTLLSYFQRVIDQDGFITALNEEQKSLLETSHIKQNQILQQQILDQVDEEMSLSSNFKNRDVKPILSMKIKDLLTSSNDEVMFSIISPSIDYTESLKESMMLTLYNITPKYFSNNNNNIISKELIPIQSTNKFYAVPLNNSSLKFEPTFNENKREIKRLDQILFNNNDDGNSSSSSSDIEYDLVGIVVFVGPNKIEESSTKDGKKIQCSKEFYISDISGHIAKVTIINNTWVTGISNSEDSSATSKSLSPYKNQIYFPFKSGFTIENELPFDKLHPGYQVSNSSNEFLELSKYLPLNYQPNQLPIIHLSNLKYRGLDNQNQILLFNTGDLFSQSIKPNSKHLVNVFNNLKNYLLNSPALFNLFSFKVNHILLNINNNNNIKYYNNNNNNKNNNSLFKQPQQQYSPPPPSISTSLHQTSASSTDLDELTTSQDIVFEFDPVFLKDSGAD